MKNRKNLPNNNIPKPHQPSRPVPTTPLASEPNPPAFSAASLSHQTQPPSTPPLSAPVCFSLSPPLCHQTQLLNSPAATSSLSSHHPRLLSLFRPAAATNDLHHLNLHCRTTSLLLSLFSFSPEVNIYIYIFFQFCITFWYHIYWITRRNNLRYIYIFIYFELFVFL